MKILPISQAPKDRPILAYCDDSADEVEDVVDDPFDMPFGALITNTGRRLTDYAYACENLSNVNDGWHVVHFVEGFWEDEGWEYPRYWVPGYWELCGTEEVCANPTHFIDIDLSVVPE